METIPTFLAKIGQNSSETSLKIEVFALKALKLMFKIIQIIQMSLIRSFCNGEEIWRAWGHSGSRNIVQDFHHYVINERGSKTVNESVASSN